MIYILLCGSIKHQHIKFFLAKNIPQLNHHYSYFNKIKSATGRKKITKNCFVLFGLGLFMCKKFLAIYFLSLPISFSFDLIIIFYTHFVLLYNNFIYCSSVCECMSLCNCVFEFFQKLQWVLWDHWKYVNRKILLKVCWLHECAAVGCKNLLNLCFSFCYSMDFNFYNGWIKGGVLGGML